MATRRGDNGSLGDVLAARRLRRFVGREGEIELFQTALATGDPPFAALYVHGPGGIGKTSLLKVLAVIAKEAGATVAHIDGQDVVPQPSGILDARSRPRYGWVSVGGCVANSGWSTALAGPPMPVEATVRWLGDGTFINKGPMARGARTTIGRCATLCADGDGCHRAVVADPAERPRTVSVRRVGAT